MSESLRVWIIDDDASIRWVLERALRNGGLAPRAFDSAEPRSMRCAVMFPMC